MAATHSAGVQPRSNNLFRQPDVALQAQQTGSTIASPWQAAQPTAASADSPPSSPDVPESAGRVTATSTAPLNDMQTLSEALPSTTSTSTSTAASTAPPLPARPATATASDEAAVPDTSEDAAIAAALARASPTPPPADEATYAPPAHLPPPRRTASSSTAPTPAPAPIAQPVRAEPAPLVPQQPFPPGYQPSHYWTPGQPLLKQGRLLLFPRGRGACYKCQNTGYKSGDPTRACANRCWSVYGCVWPDQVLRVLSRPEARAQLELQRPMPDWRDAPTAMRIYHTPILPLPMFAPPPPPQQGLGQPVQRRRRASPPRVNRTQQAAEEAVDEEGEAPPSYEDVARAPSTARLDPQRTGTVRRTGAGASSSAASTSGAGDTVMQDVQQPSSTPVVHAPPPQQPPPPLIASIPGGFPGAVHHVSRPAAHAPYPHPQQHPQPTVHIPGRAYARPPPGAVIVQPGDPRIGGRRCFKCNGRGVRESFLFGDETCNYCNGLGRLV